MSEILTQRLSSEEINQRLDKFNENYDWSVFDDVPESQFVDIMYPHRMIIANCRQIGKTKCVDFFIKNN